MRLIRVDLKLFLFLTWNLNSIKCDKQFLIPDLQKFPYERNLSRLINRLFPPKETLNLIFCQSLQEDAITDLLSLIENPQQVSFLENPTTETTLFYHEHYLLYSENLSRLKTCIGDLRNGSLWHISKSPRGKYLLITQSNEDLDEFFEYLWDFDITNIIIVVVTSENRTLQVFTSNPFNHGAECAKNSHHRSRKVNKVQFTEVLRNIRECQLQLLSPNPISKSMKRNGSYAVIAYLIELIAEKLGLKSKISIIKSPNEILQNRSMDISVFSTMSRASDLYENYDITELLYSDPEDWILPKARKISDLKLIASVFNNHMWMMIFTVFVTTLLTWWIMAVNSHDLVIFRSFTRSFLLVFDILLWGSTNILPKTNPLRVLTVFYLLYCLEITSLFQARLMSVLTEPGNEHQISTMKEYADSDIHPIIPKGFLTVAFANTEDENFAQLKKRFITPERAEAEVNIRTVAYNRNYSTIMGRMLTRLFTKELPYIYVIQRNSGLLAVEVAVGVRKGHYIMNSLNQLIRRIFESGFHIKVLLDSADSPAYKKEPTPVRVFSMNHLLGGFMWWFLGLLFATIVFVGELIFYRSKKRGFKLKKAAKV